MIRTRALALLHLLFAGLWLAMGDVAPVADAILEAQNAHARTHIEAHSDSTCPLPHGPDCPICQFSHAVADRPSPATLCLPAGESRARVAASVARLTALSPLSPLPRAPPALS